MIHAHEFFRERDPNEPFRLHPLNVSRFADRVTNNFVPQNDLGADDHERPGAIREVIYHDVGNDIYQSLTLKLVQHNGGAWTNLDNAVRGVQSGLTEGRFVVSDGTMSVAATQAILVKGGLFANYYDEKASRPNRGAPTPTPLTDLQNGDWYWVVVGGPYEYYGAAACAIGLPLGLGGVAQEGQLEDHTAVIAAGTDRAVGWCTADPGAVDQFGQCRLELDEIGFALNQF